MNLGELLNLVGLSTGVALYAMLLAMVIRARRRAGDAAAFDPLLLLTSVLGLLWNLCSLPGYVLPKFGIAGPFPLISAIGFGALGLLPAAVVHSVLRGNEGIGGGIRRVVGILAYAVSTIAAILQLAAALNGDNVPSSAAMRLLTYGFVVLVVPLALATRGQPGARRALWATALAVFAVSAMHLSQLHSANTSSSWPVELLGHHASLPLALAILYQDYPFALADLFLKRALALLAVVAIAFVAVATFGDRSAAFAAFIEHDARQFAVLLTLWVATALMYPSLRSAVAWFVDTVLLQRPDYRAVREGVGRAVQALDDPEMVLATVAAEIAPALSSPRVTWEPLNDATELAGPLVTTGKDAITRVIVPTVEGPRYIVTIAPLTRGRRLLSDDVATLEAIVTSAARRIDAIRVTHERHAREIREREMGRLATEAELRALRAQINPHFLFNALTTIGYLIQTAPPRALETLLRLTSLLRSVLRSEGEFTTLGRELDVIEAYLDIERARFEQRLRVSFDVPPKLRYIRLPALVLQPIVENAVKHGVAPRADGGDIRIVARIESGVPPRLSIRVSDTGAGVSEDALRQGRQRGVGLRNVERRLQGQYGASASLSIESRPGAGTLVEVRMPVTGSPAENSAHQVAV